MHAPDGFYGNGLCLTADIICLIVLIYSVKKIWKKIDGQQLLLASSVGAFCFSLQIINFNVSRGTSCHFIGGVLTSIILGPYLATIIMTCIHLIQVFLFQEGGIMALGPNLLTIACISTFGGYYFYSLLKNVVIEPYGDYLGSFLSTWLTLSLTSLTVCGMLAISKTENFSATLAPMVGPHVIIGIAEGLMNVIILFIINQISIRSSKEKSSLKVIETISCLFLGGALLVSLICSPFASRSQDGLRKFINNRPHLISQRIIIFYHAPIPDYHIQGINSHLVSHIISGIIGSSITFFICLLITYLMAQKKYFENS